MATAISPAVPVDLQVGPPLYRLSVEQYERMIEAGILCSGDPIELIEGCLVRKVTQTPPHAVALDYLSEAVRGLIPEGWRYREQKPIRLADSEPESDLVVIRGPKERYAARHPTPADIALVIEVSDERLRYDRETKKRIYARARLPIYWIINLPESRVEVYTQPRAGINPTYRHCVEYGRDGAVPFELAGELRGAVAVKDLLPTTAS